MCPGSYNLQVNGSNCSVHFVSEQWKTFSFVSYPENQHVKHGKDAADWMDSVNRNVKEGDLYCASCWNAFKSKFPNLEGEHVPREWLDK